MVEKYKKNTMQCFCTLEKSCSHVVNKVRQVFIFLSSNNLLEKCEAIRESIFKCFIPLCTSKLHLGCMTAVHASYAIEFHYKESFYPFRVLF